MRVHLSTREVGRRESSGTICLILRAKRKLLSTSDLCQSANNHRRANENSTQRDLQQFNLPPDDHKHSEKVMRGAHWTPLSIVTTKHRYCCGDEFGAPDFPGSHILTRLELGRVEFAASAKERCLGKKEVDLRTVDLVSLLSDQALAGA